LVVAPELLEHAAAIAESLRVIGPHREGAVIALDRLWVALQLPQNISTIVVSLRIISLERDGAVVARKRFVGETQILERVAAVIVRGSDIGIDRERGVDLLDRCLALAPLVMNHPEKMQAVEVTGVRGQDLAVDPRSLGQSAGLVRPHRLAESRDQGGRHGPRWLRRMRLADGAGGESRSLLHPCPCGRLPRRAGRTR